MAFLLGYFLFFPIPPSLPRQLWLLQRPSVRRFHCHLFHLLAFQQHLHFVPARVHRSMRNAVVSILVLFQHWEYKYLELGSEALTFEGFFFFQLDYIPVLLKRPWETLLYQMARLHPLAQVCCDLWWWQYALWHHCCKQRSHERPSTPGKGKVRSQLQNETGTNLCKLALWCRTGHCCWFWGAFFFFFDRRQRNVWNDLCYLWRLWKSNAWFSADVNHMQHVSVDRTQRKCSSFVLPSFHNHVIQLVGGEGMSEMKAWRAPLTASFSDSSFSSSSSSFFSALICSNLCCSLAYSSFSCSSCSASSARYDDDWKQHILNLNLKLAWRKNNKKEKVGSTKNLLFAGV